MSMNYKNLKKESKKTIFFTGANGYLGTKIKTRLVQAGHTVIVWEEDLTQEISWDFNNKTPTIDLIIHFGRPDNNLSEIQNAAPNSMEISYYQAWDKVNANINKFAKKAKCPIIHASTEAIELSIPDIKTIISTTVIKKKDIFNIQKFNLERNLNALPNSVINLRIPLVLDESIMDFKPNSWYAKIRKSQDNELDLTEDLDFYTSNKNDRLNGRIPTIPILSLDRFSTITLAKIYEVLKEDNDINNLKKKLNKEIFRYDSINLEFSDVVKKIKAGFWS